MTTKDKLQQELLAKIKGGIKPSDLKKQRPKPSKTTKTPPPIVQKDDRRLSDFDKPDDGYDSERSIGSFDKEAHSSTKKPTANKQIQQLKKDVNYWSTTATTHLKNLQLAQAKIVNL